METSIFMCVGVIFELTVGYRFNHLAMPIQIIRMNDLLMFKMKNNSTRMSRTWCSNETTQAKITPIAFFPLGYCMCMSFYKNRCKKLRSNKIGTDLIENFWTKRMNWMWLDDAIVHVISIISFANTLTASQFPEIEKKQRNSMV